MPLNVPTKVFGAPAILDSVQDTDGDGVGFLDALPAAFRRENATLNLVELGLRKLRFGISGAQDDSFNPYENTEGTIVDEFPDALVGVSSQEEKDVVIQRLHREKKDLEILDTSGGMGLLAMFTAGVLDPLMFVPVGTAFRATRVAKLAASGANVTPGALRTAALTSRAGLLAATGAEIPLQLNQETRTAAESAMNIGAAVVLSGVLGGALGAAMSKELRAASLHDVDRVIGGSDPRISVGDLAPPVTGSESRALIKVAQGFGIPTAIAKARLTPMLTRMIESPTQSVKRALLRMVDQPFIVEGVEEIPSIQSVLRQYRFVQDELDQARSDLYRKYRQRTKGQKFQLKQKEFIQNAGEAQRVDSDAHGYTREGRVTIEPEAKELASLHNRLYEDFAQQMVDLKMLPEEVIEQGPAFASRYLSRRYLTEKIQLDRDATGGRRFEGIVRGWLRETMTAEERAAAVKLRPDLPEDAAVEAAIAHAGESITDHIVGLAPGQGIVGSPRVGGGSPFQQRVLAWDDSRVVDYLDNDIANLTDQYVRSVAPRIELHKLDSQYTQPLPVGATLEVSPGKFVTVKEGDVLYAKGTEPSHDLKNLIQATREEYRELVRLAGADTKKVDKLLTNQKRDEKVIKAFRDRLLGTFGSGEGFQGLKSAARTARAVNLPAHLGGVSMSSIPDTAMNPFRNGLTRTFGTAVQSAFNPKLFKMSAAESKLTGAVAESSRESRFLELAELGGANAPNAIEAGANRIAAGFGSISLIQPWNKFWKIFSGAVFQSRLIDVTQAMASGKRVSPSDLTDLAQVRIGPEMARRIAAQLNAPNGMTGSGFVKFGNTAAWTDDGARLAYRTAVGQQIDNTILTPGPADRPLFMSTEWGKSMGQYKSFAFASTGRILVTGFQHLRAGDLYRLNGLALMVTMGALVEDSKRALRDEKPEPKDSLEWWLAGLDRSGAAGILGDAAHISQRAGLGMFPGGPISSRFAARNTTSALLGPTAGLFETSLQLAAATRAGFTEADVKAGVRIIPYNNLFYWKTVFGKMPVDIAADAFNRRSR